MIEALIMPDSVFTYSSDGEPGRCLVWTNLNRVTLILVLMHILLVLQAECLSPSRALAHDGHRLSPGDHRAWLSSDGGSGQGPSARADRLAQTEREAQEGGGMGGHGPAPAAGARPGEIMGEGQSLLAVPVVAQWVKIPTSIHDVAGSIPGFTQWAENSVLP